MVNIVLLHEGELPTLEEVYRSFQYLVKNYDVSLKKINSNHFSNKYMRETDVLICVRGHSPITYSVLKEASRLQKKICYFLDDDLKDMPRGSFWFPARGKWLIKCIGVCDTLMTTNRLIADEYKEYLKAGQTVLINATVIPETIQKPRSQDDTTKIVMAASEWHTQNFNRYVKDACIKISEEYRTKVEFYFIGIHPDMTKIGSTSKIEYVPSMNMETYVNYMTKNKYDIGIGVLKPNHFTERKYFNKFIEYTRYGICGIYSKCMPFELVVLDGINGIYTENTVAGWYRALKKLIDEPSLRRKCIENAQEYLRTKHNEKYIFTRLISECPWLVNFKAGRAGNMSNYHILWKVRQIIFRITERIYLTLLSLSLFGLPVTIKKIKRKIKPTGGK